MSGPVGPNPFTTPPPPRPSRLQIPEPPQGAPSWGDLKVQLQKRPAGPTMRQVANRNLGIGMILGALLAAGIIGGLLSLSDTPVPRCTDQIADAGGVCYGEPLPPCPTEDSTGCYWDAQTMGNGRGTSFVAP